MVTVKFCPNSLTIGTLADNPQLMDLGNKSIMIADFIRDYPQIFTDVAIMHLLRFFSVCSFNITVRIYSSYGGSDFVEDPGSLWRALYNGEVDMFPYDMILSAQRMNRGHFSMPYAFSPMLIILGGFSPSSSRNGALDTLSTPFGTDLWILTVATLVIGLILTIFPLRTKFGRKLDSAVFMVFMLLPYLYSCNLRTRCLRLRTKTDVENIGGLAYMVRNAEYRLVIERTDDYRYEMLQSSRLSGARDLGKALRVNPPLVVGDNRKRICLLGIFSWFFFLFYDCGGTVSRHKKLFIMLLVKQIHL